MLTVVQARAAMLAAVKPLDSESVALAEAAGRILAAPVIARRDQPPQPVSEMDGYALRSADTPGRLRMIGESAGGRHFSGRLEPGTAIRISTGATVPTDADAVVIQENVRRDGDIIETPLAISQQHIRPRGLDFRSGKTLLAQTTRLDGVALALAAASGTGLLPVVRKPRIAILGGGDELVEPGNDAGPHQIYDSATYGLAALVCAWGGTAQRFKPQRDDRAAIAHTAEQGLRESDLLVLIGGASVGDHDHARAALTAIGIDIACERIALRPGKPTWFGTTQFGPVLGLPGNPASALTCGYLFLRPLIEAMLGRDPMAVVRLRGARLALPLPANGARENYLRARVDVDDGGTMQAQAFENQDSSLLSVFASANAFIRMMPHAPAAAAGDMCDILLMDDL
ncbi:MAG TPA: gephyrin-like molybdotransferase Glp [Rhizomicrobium sp.]|jgi:molybdopterin molybdotransferase|nr:gephyrin-like molybdotransferase Glp [Rhizomicrobium sp.]